MLQDQVKTPIAKHLAMVTVAIAFAIGALLSMSQVYRDYQEQGSSFQHIVAQILAVAERPATTAVHILNEDLALEVVTGLLEYDFIVKATIKDELDLTLAEGSKPDGSPSSTKWLTSKLTELHREHKILLYPASTGTDKPGLLCVTVNNDIALQSFYQRAGTTLVGGIARNLLLAVLLLLVFYYVITKPLIRIANQFPKDVQAGGQSCISVPQGHEDDEIGLLCATANRYISDDRLHKQQLVQKNQELQDEALLRNQAEQELRAAQDELLAILNNSRAVIYIKDLDLNYLMINRAYGSIIQRDPATVIGKSDFDLFPSEVAEKFQAIDRKVLASGETTEAEELAVHKDGTEHTYISVKFPLFNPDGEPYAVCGISTDISHRIESEASLEEVVALRTAEAIEASQAKSRFLATMSHEIRTPIHGVLGLSKMGEKEHDAVKVQELFTKIGSAGQHLLQIVNDLLDFSKIEAGKLDLDIHPFNVSEHLREAIELLQETAKDKRLRLTLDVADTLPAVIDGDSQRIRQVLINLISNAIKYTDNGEVSVSAGMDGDHWTIAVTDTGVGIHQSELARLFTPFEQLDASMTRRHGGTGLGLAICHGLVTQMGGTISVDSKPGLGSTFTVKLPLTISETATTQPETLDQIEPDALSGLRILVAEDVEINRMIIEDILRTAGADVELVENGELAVEAVTTQERKPFHVVLMDLQMPVMDGYQATEQLLERYPYLPIIGVTAHALKTEYERTAQAGMCNHISKPIDPGELVEAVLQATAVST